MLQFILTERGEYQQTKIGKVPISAFIALLVLGSNNMVTNGQGLQSHQSSEGVFPGSLEKHHSDTAADSYPAPFAVPRPDAIRVPQPTANAALPNGVAYTFVPFNHTLVPGRFFPATDTDVEGEVYVPNGFVYVGANGGDYLVVVNPSTGVGITMIPFAGKNGAGSPKPLVYDPLLDALFVNVGGTGYASILSLRTGQIVGRLGDGNGFSFGAFDPADDLIFLSGYVTGNITVVNATSGVVVHSFSVDPLLWSIAYDPANHLLYALGGSCSCLHAINVTTYMFQGQRINFGATPQDLAIDNQSGTVYVANGSYVTVVNASTNLVSSRISVGGAPNGLAFDWRDSELFVSGAGPGVQIVSTRTDQLVGGFFAETPQGVAYDSRDGFTYVAEGLSDNLTAFDAGKGAIQYPDIPIGPTFFSSTYDPRTSSVYVAEVNGASDFTDQGSLLSLDGGHVRTAYNWSTPVGAVPERIAIDNRTGEIYVANAGSSSVTILNETTHSTVRVVAVAGWAMAVVYDWQTDDVYVAIGSDLNVTVINGTTRTVQVAAIRVGLNPDALAFDPQNGYVYVANYGSNSVVAIDGRSFKLVGSPVSVGPMPADLALDPANGYLYVADSGSKNLTVIDGATNQVVVQNLSVGGGPVALAIDPARNLVFSANAMANTISIVNGSNNSLAEAPIQVGPNPQGVSFDPATDQLFVSVYGAGSIQVLADVPTSDLQAVPSPTEVGVATTFVTNVSGGYPPYAFQYAGLPPGCTSQNIARIDCIPRATGTYSVSVYASDTRGYVGHGTTVIRITGGVTIQSFSATPRTLDLGGTTSITVRSSGGTGASTAAYSGLPGGCLPNGTFFFCTPTTVGSFVVSVTVTDSEGSAAVATILLVVNPDPSILLWVASPPNVTLGESVLFVAEVLGGSPPFTYAFGGLPTGCRSFNASSLHCTPSVTGQFNVTVQISDSTGFIVTAVASVIVSSPVTPRLQITYFEAVPAVLELGNTTVLVVETANSTGMLTYAFVGLPSGCSSRSTPVLDCRPLRVGTFAVNVTVSGSSSERATAQVDIEVIAPSSASAPPGIVTLFVEFAVGFIGVGVALGVALTTLVKRRKPRKDVADPGRPGGTE